MISFDTVMAVIAVAIAIGQVAAANQSDRKRTMLIGFAVLACLITIAVVGKNWIEERKYAKEIARAQDHIVQVVKKPSTFDDIYANVYYDGFNIVNDAIDALVENKQMSTEMAEVADDQGGKHKVRFFTLRTVR
jgi:hypothetical protein